MDENKVEMDKTKEETEDDTHTMMVEEKVRTPANWWQQLRQVDYRRRLCVSLLIALAIFIYGAEKIQSGSTFLDLQLITHTDARAASAFFTAHSVGFLVGSALSGILSKKVNRSLTLSVCLVGVGVCSVVTPYCREYFLMIVVKAVDGVFCGVIATVGHAEHMRLWGNQGRPLLQLIHLCFSLGGLVSPLYTEPFLSPLVGEAPLDNSTHIASHRGVQEEFQTFSNSFPNNSQDIGLLNHGNNTVVLSPYETQVDYHHNSTSSVDIRVHHAYLITGIMAFCGSLPLAVTYFYFRGSKLSRNSSISNNVGEKTQRKLPTCTSAGLICCLCTFFITYACMEETFISFLMTFAVRTFSSVTKSQGAFLTAIFWAAIVSARFLAVFVSNLLLPIKMLYISAVVILFSFAGLTVGAMFDVTEALSIFVATSGIGLATVIGTGILWIESELMHVSSFLSSCIFVSGSLGKMLNPLLLAYLMEQVSEMWYCYMLVLYFVIMVAIMTAILVWNRCYLNKRFGPLSQIKAEIE